MLPFYIRCAALDKGAYYLPNLLVPKANIIDLDAGNIEIEQIIPYADDGNMTSLPGFFSYINQTPTQGKLVKSVELNIAAANSTVVIAFAADAAGLSRVWVKEFKNLPIGKAILDVDRMHGVGEFLCFSGGFKYSSARPNTIGGGFAGGATNTKADLCIGVNCVSSNGNGAKKVNYIALGDSIPEGTGASAPYPKLLSFKLGGTFKSLAVSGAKCLGSTGNVLITQVNQVPEGFEGLITIGIGTNDVYQNSLLGDSAIVLAKPFEELNASASFAEAFRLNLETLLLKSPKATVIVILPLKAWSGASLAKIELYRQVEREICDYYAIPCSELHKECTISPLTYPRLMPDKLHPNDDGHVEIMRVLWGDVMKYLGYIIE